MFHCEVMSDSEKPLSRRATWLTMAARGNRGGHEKMSTRICIVRSKAIWFAVSAAQQQQQQLRIRVKAPHTSPPPPRVPLVYGSPDVGGLPTSAATQRATIKHRSTRPELAL